MSEKMKKLKLYGIMYLASGILNGISMLWGVIDGRYNTLSLVESSGFPERYAMLFEMLAFVVAAGCVAGHMYLGEKGYTYGAGLGYGIKHIFVSKCLQYVLILQILINIGGFFIGQIDYVSLVTAIVGVYCIRDYRRCARIVLMG